MYYFVYSVWGGGGCPWGAHPSETPHKLGYCDKTVSCFAHNVTYPITEAHKFIRQEVILLLIAKASVSLSFNSVISL